MADALAQLKKATWADLTEPQPFATKTWVERNPDHAPAWLSHWLEYGAFMLDPTSEPEWMDLIDRYIEARTQLPKETAFRDNYYSGWSFPTSYLACPEMANLALSKYLVEPLNSVLNENALLHLALTGWISTERNWHQDSYLNPPNVWSSYVAVWIALDDIHSDSGPFEFVPGSHQWDVLRREKLFKRLPAHIRESPAWPTITQNEIARVCDEKIRSSGFPIERFLPTKGQVLVWHSNLVHRGTQPNNPEMLRKALILHYSGLSKRPDMQPVKQYGSSYYYDGPIDANLRMMK